MTTKKIIIISFSIFLLATPAAGQDARNSISLEIGKTGLIYNLNFDHSLKPGAGLRMVIGSNFSRNMNAIHAGIGGYKLFGKQKHHFECGLDVNFLKIDEVSDDQKGFSFVYPDYTVNTYYLSLNFGYRRLSGKTIFRAGISPGYIKDGFIPGGYVSYGLQL